MPEHSICCVEIVIRVIIKSNKLVTVKLSALSSLS